jgi:hypothetical protein
MQDDPAGRLGGERDGGSAATLVRGPGDDSLQVGTAGVVRLA